jgi:phosphotransferase system HPr (HPr) family protein
MIEGMQMVTKEIVIQSKIGLHARPAALFVKLASRFQSEIKVIKGEKEANGKSLLGLLALSVLHGDLIELCISGEDEEEALRELSHFLETSVV